MSHIPSLIVLTVITLQLFSLYQEVCDPKVLRCLSQRLSQRERGWWRSKKYLLARVPVLMSGEKTFYRCLAGYLVSCTAFWAELVFSPVTLCFSLRSGWTLMRCLCWSMEFIPSEALCPLILSELVYDF